MNRNKIALVLVLAIALAGILVFSKSPIFRLPGKSEVPLCPGCNVIMILIDTLRADHLPCYGYERNTAPNICGLAEEGFLFRKMYSNSPSTKTSVASLFTSMLPSQHKSIHNEDVLDDGLTTMAEILAEHGYHTYAVVGNPVIKTQFNYDQGFEIWKENLTRATRRNQVVLDSLDTFKQPFLFYLHYMDPHSAYTAPGKFSRFFNGDYRGPVTGVGPYEESYFQDRPDELAQLVAFYDNEIRFVDHKVGELFDKLKKLGLYEDSLIILLADHGEMFLEHGQFEHSNGLYTEVIDVPLIIRLPNHEKVVVDTPVQTVDILPTLLSLLEIDVDLRFMGRPIFPLSGSDEARPITTEQLRARHPRSPETALILGDYKLIKQMQTNDFLLYDMKNDPEERENVIDRAPNAAELIEQLDSVTQANASTYEGVQTKTITLDEETHDQLKELGYIQ